MAMQQGVQVVCRKCGRHGPLSSFKLDERYGMVVCHECRAEKDLRSPAPTKRPATPSGGKAPGSVSRQAAPAPASRAAAPASRSAQSADRTKRTCEKCSFSFTYVAEKAYPSKCPYCGAPVKK
ncbi:hypothetical protein JXB02_04305 [Candidatus Woesearchaeota archaeon]|nr:hypothetical protein [Candidatus Woesearchaeota archaeon]